MKFHKAEQSCNWMCDSHKITLWNLQLPSQEEALVTQQWMKKASGSERRAVKGEGKRNAFFNQYKQKLGRLNLHFLPLTDSSNARRHSFMLQSNTVGLQIRADSEKGWLCDFGIRKICVSTSVHMGLCNIQKLWNIIWSEGRDYISG